MAFQQSAAAAACVNHVDKKHFFPIEPWRIGCSDCGAVKMNYVYKRPLNAVLSQKSPGNFTAQEH